MIRLAAKKVIENHFMKIAIRKIHGERTRAVTLTRHIAFWIKIGQPDLDGIRCLNYEDLCHSYDNGVRDGITFPLATHVLNPPRTKRIHMFIYMPRALQMDCANNYACVHVHVCTNHVCFLSLFLMLMNIKVYVQAVA